MKFLGPLTTLLILPAILVAGQESNGTVVGDVFSEGGYEFCRPLNSSDWEGGSTSLSSNLLIDYSCLDGTITVGSELEVSVKLTGQEGTRRDCQYAAFFEMSFSSKGSGTTRTFTYKEFDLTSGTPYNFTYSAFPENVLESGNTFDVEVNIQTYGINLPDADAPVALDDFFGSAMIGSTTYRQLEVQEDGSCVENASSAKKTFLWNSVIAIATVWVTLLLIG